MHKIIARRLRSFPFYSFFVDSRSVGITLLMCTALSLILTNLGSIGVAYHDFWLKEISFFHQLSLPSNLLHFVNDALMAIFFFHVGIEIKREAIVGELMTYVPFWLLRSFYGNAPELIYLGGVIFCIGATLLVFKKISIKKARNLLFVIIGLTMWYCMYNSGIHATFAGIIMALLLPIDKITRYESILNFPVNFIIIPIFALANTSLYISGASFANLASPLSMAIILGLFVGKPLGIISAAFLLVKTKIINLPKNVTLTRFLGVGFLAGIGFTMSIFISTLAFENKLDGDTSKLAVLIASLLSMIIGFIWLKLSFPPKKEEGHEVKVEKLIKK